MKKDGAPSSLLVMVAALNEEKGIGPTLAELKTVLGNPRFLVIDGNSNDRTIQIAKEMGAEILFQEGIGKGDAIACAIRSVDFDVKYVVFTDADFTYPAECLPRMIQILEENPEVGMVCGNRFNSHVHLSAMKSLFYMGNRFLAWAQLMLNHVNLRDPLTGLRVIRWSILKKWEPKSKGFDIEVEMNHLVEKQQYKTVEIPIVYRKRIGEKKLKLRDGLIILRRIIAESLTKNQ